MALIVEIASVDKTSDIYRPSGGGSLTIEMALQSDWTMELASTDPVSTSSAYRAALDDALAIRDGTTVWGHGRITKVNDQPYEGQTSTGTVTRIRALAFSAYVDQAVLVDETFAAGQTLKQIVTVLHTNYLNGRGVGIDATMASGPTLEAQSFVDVTLRQALDHLSTITGYVWRIIPKFGSFGELQFFAPGVKTAPFSLTAANKLSVHAITWEQVRTKYVNHLTLRYGVAEQVSKTDTFTGTAAAGETNFDLTYTPLLEGGVIISSGYVSEGGVNYPLGSAVGGVTWSYDSANNRLQRSADLGTGVSAEFRYTVQFPQTIVVEDAAEIAAHGQYDGVFDAPTITTYDEALERANGLLRRYTEAPKTVRVSTREQSPVYPGDAITLTFANRTISGTYLVQSNTVTDVAMDKTLEQTLVCLEGSEHQEEWIDQFRDLLGIGGGARGIAGVVSGGAIPNSDGRFADDVVAHAGGIATPRFEVSLDYYIDSSTLGGAIILGRRDKTYTWAIVADTLYDSGDGHRLKFTPWGAGPSGAAAMVLCGDATDQTNFTQHYLISTAITDLDLGDYLGKTGSVRPLNNLYIGCGQGPMANPLANVSTQAAYFAASFQEASSGTHGQFATVVINAPTVFAGAAALTEAVSLYISGAPSGGTANAALRINSGALVLGPASAGFGNQFIVNNASPTLDMYESDGGSDAKFWRFNVQSEIFTLQKLTDAYGSATTLFQMDRSGNAFLINLEINGFQQFDEQGSNPASPSADGPWRVYAKADKFVLVFNNSSTVRYFTLDGTSSSGTWAHSTSAP